MDSLYEVVGMDVLPDEYLPEDYNGPSAGPLQQIIRTYSHRILTSFFRRFPLLEAALRIPQCTVNLLRASR